MTRGASFGRWAEFEVVRPAVAFTVLAGALAVLLPFLNALVAALAAIAVAGAVRPGPRPPDGPGRRRAARWSTGAIVAAGAVLFVTLPAPWSIGRGVVLAVATLPLVLVARGPSAGGPGRGGGP